MSLVSTNKPSNETPKLLLRLFPAVIRKDEKPDKVYAYHHGLALYEDAEPIVNRVKELESAGLPPPSGSSRFLFTHLTPGPVDFSALIHTPILPEPTESIITS